MRVDADYLTSEGANQLAARLRGYWRARGFSVEARVEQVAASRKDNLRGTVFAVRSDLLRGLPQQRLVAEKIKEAA
jgi:hypothetical protein